MLDFVDTTDADQPPPGKLLVTFDPKVPADISNEVFNELQSAWGIFDPLDRDSILISREVLDQVVATDPRFVISESFDELRTIKISLKNAVENTVPAAVSPVAMAVANNPHDPDNRTWTPPGEWHELNKAQAEAKAPAQNIVDALCKKSPRRFNNSSHQLVVHWLAHPIAYSFRGEKNNAYYDNYSKELKPIEVVEKWANEVFNRKSAEATNRYWKSQSNQ